MDVTTIVTSMASLTRKPRSKFWFACFRDANGRQRRKSTKTSDRKKAIKIAEQYEQVAQRKMPVRTVRETLAELYREMYNASVPTATVRGFIENWLNTKQPEISPATLAFYRKHKQVTRILGIRSGSRPRLGYADDARGIQESGGAEGLGDDHKP